MASAAAQRKRCVAGAIAAAALSSCSAFVPGTSALVFRSAVTTAAASTTAAAPAGYASSSRRRLRVLNEPVPAEVLAGGSPEAELEAEIRSRNLSLSESPATSQVSSAAPSKTSKAKTPLRASKAANLVIESDTLVDEPYMIAIVAVTVTVAAAMMAGAVGGVAASSAPLASAALALAAAVGGVLFSDVFSGFFHWSVDNYGDINTPVFGAVIEAFQGHHGSPWTITYRNFANNVHKIAYGVLPLLCVLALAHPGPSGTIFGVTSLIGLLMCQELHKYSHMVRPPQWVARLQKSGWILSKKEHGLHHTSPFEGKYCIVTGHCNEFLDNSGIFRQLERVIYERTGVEPNCWKLDASGDIKAAALGTAPTV